METIATLVENLCSLVVPKVCCSCTSSLADAWGSCVCKTCASSLVAVPQDVVCRFCGIPLLGAEDQCPSCRLQGEDTLAVRSLWWFDGLGRTLVHQAKFKGNRSVVPFLANKIQGVLPGITRDFLHEAKDWVLCPIPPHPWSLWKRGWDLTALLASKLEGFTIEKVLERRLLSKHQKDLGRQARLSNIESALWGRSSMLGKNVVLFDDVMTTGATMAAAARVVRDLGAKRVRGLVIFRA